MNNITIKRYCLKCHKDTEHSISLSLPGTQCPVLCSECCNINGIMHLGNVYCNE
jgi:hypothetical protein